MFKISDFRVAKDIIISACKSTDSAFVDLEVVFDESNYTGLRDGKIVAGNPDHLTSTIFNIVWTYLANFKEISGCEVFTDDKHKNIIFDIIVSYLRKLYYQDELFPSDENDYLNCRLYVFSMTWIILKDIVCPVYGVNIENHKVITVGSSRCDISYFDKEKNVILLNNHISYAPSVYSSLLIESIKAHNLDPNKVFSELLKSESRYFIEGLAKLEFNDDLKVKDYMNMLAVYSSVDTDIESMMNNDKIKTAQNNFSASLGSSWWFLGLIEQMLEPARGSDWSTYQLLDPLRKEVWDKIEEARKKAGRDGISYESMLRIKDGEVDNSKVQVIERTLGSDRVW